MLQKIFIRNYAIIDEIEIDFSGKLTIITGETGAGKSIIVGALGLILGERADSASLVNLTEKLTGKEKKCIVEGYFLIAGIKEIKDYLEQNDFDESDIIVVRREINVNGKSRAFINDTPVTLSQLTELSLLLVDLHQQFDSLELGKTNFQRDVLDALAGHRSLVEEYRKKYTEWQNNRNEWEVLKQKKLQFDKEFDYYQFQYNELEEAKFMENELENLDNEMKLLTHAEKIKTSLSDIYVALKEGELPVVQQLKVLQHQLQAYSSYHPALPSLLQRIRSAQIELQDIAEETEHISGHVHFDPGKIELINERLSLGYRLQKKHGVKTTNELLQIKQQLEAKLGQVLNIDALIHEKEKIDAKLFAEATQLASEISEGRNKQVKPLETKVNRLLARVGMPNAKLKVTITSGELKVSGADEIEFMFNANLPSGPAEERGQYQPVRKVASGGELSRLMLCIKSLVAESIDMATLIFDEIDSGISGEAARQVGIIMKELSLKRQVICITHQPQIAGKANEHYLVYKEIVGDRVKTNIRLLNMEERITAIARMLSGEKPTAAAMENAREMVSN